MKAIIIDHPFFDEGAILFVVKGEIAILSPADRQQFQVWYTGIPYEKKKLYHLLEEFREGKHDTLGSSAIGTFKEMIDDIKQTK